MESITFMSSFQEIQKSQIPKISPFPSGFFSDCEATNPCIPTKPLTLSYYPGVCIPNKASILACSKNLFKCACSLEPTDCFDTRGCFYQLQIIDIYIVNNTNQQLHLKDSKIDLIVNDLGEESEEDLEQQEVIESGLPSDFMVGWVSSAFAPPKVVDIGETVLVRGAVSCVLNCCQSDVTFQIRLAYNIGIPSKNLGILNASVCRNKPKESKDSVKDCISSSFICSGEGCKIHFGKLEQCSGTTIGISPPSEVYSVEPNINNTQLTLSLTGGKSNNECNNKKDCPNGEKCFKNKCISAKGCVEGECDAGFVCTDGVCVRKSNDNTNKNLAIAISVGVISVVLVFTFLFYLSDLGKRK